MKEYSDYMNSIQVSAELHEKIMQRVAQKPSPRLLPIAAMRYAMPVACAAAAVLCVLVIPGLLRTPVEDEKSGPGSSAVIFDPNEYYKTGEEGVPENYALTLEQAKNDADFGAYVPLSVPPEFSFRSAQKSADTGGASLCVIWDEAGGGNSSITWKISTSIASEPGHIVYASEREKYDMALYKSPFNESVPEELWEYFKNPVFPADELTLDTVSARAYRSASSMDEARGLRMAFSVLYGDVLVRVDTNGATPGQLFEMLTNGVAGGQDTKVSFKEEAGAMDGFESATGN